MANGEPTKPAHCEHNVVSRHGGTLFKCDECGAVASVSFGGRPPPSQPTGGDGITEKQKSFLENLLRKNDMDLDQAIEATVEQYPREDAPDDGAEIDDLTKRFASKVIDTLIKWGEGPGKPKEPKDNRREGRGPASQPQDDYARTDDDIPF